MYKINTGRNYFGIIATLEGWYVVPGWHKVPEGTTREEIELVYDEPSYLMETPTESTETSDTSWEVEGSKGAIYKVTLRNNRWDCTCPARNFRRGDCKHIKAKKELVS